MKLGQQAITGTLIFFENRKVMILLNSSVLTGFAHIFAAMKKWIAAAVLVYLSQVLSAQTPDKEGSLVKWISLKEALAKNETNPRPIILDFYTDWCGWCKHMMKTTYADPNLAGYINNYFYAAKFDAEGKDTIEYLGQKYYPTAPGPRSPHQLALKMLQGRLSYPSTVFLNGYDKEKKEFSLNMIAAGYLETRKFEPMLIFSLENVYRNSNFDDFNVQYEKAFYDSTTDLRLKDLMVVPAKTFFEKGAKSSGKKSLVFLNTDWCNGCKVMKRTSFNDPRVSAYLNEKFEIVDFNPEITDSLYYNDKAFGNQNGNPTKFHQLAFELTKGGFSFPSLIIMDEQRVVVDVIPLYLNPAVLDDVLHYYGENLNKVKSWQDYMATRQKK
jgi:thioredoxin-related protein